MKVRPKKRLGQHFLTDLKIAERIADSLTVEKSISVLEIGAGMGVLTDFLLKKHSNFKVIEIDDESVKYLEENYPELDNRIIHDDFLKADLSNHFNGEFAIIGNFPYNISSQILFKMFENKEFVPQLVGMFQKEVAERIASKEGSKKYGILSVLIQAFYDVEYLFTVDETVFNPPPKVKSGVIRVTRKDKLTLDCNEKFFKTVIKTGFGQRRKTLRNSLKSILGKVKIEHEIMSKRPEQLSVEEFVLLTNLVEESIKNMDD